MAQWALTDKSEYLDLNLRAHDILENIPIHDVWRLDLPGGGEGRSIADIRSLISESKSDVLTRLLFNIRWLLGWLFGWDKEVTNSGGLFQNNLSEEDKVRSSVATGTKDGPFTLLYVYPTEMMSEIRNATVHAALVSVLLKKEKGYRLLWVIYVKPIGLLTPFYMFLIAPFRRWVVYPSILRRLHRSWRLKYN